MRLAVLACLVMGCASRGKSKQSTFPVMGELLARFGGVGRVVGPVEWPGGRPLASKLVQVGLALALALREASGQASSS